MNSCRIIVFGRCPGLSPPDWSYAHSRSCLESTRYTSFHPPPVFGLRIAGRPTYDRMSSQSSGYFRFRSDWSLMSEMYDLFGNTTVFGTATPSMRARVHSKNFSSASHQNGSFTTTLPRTAMLLRWAREYETSWVFPATSP